MVDSLRYFSFQLVITGVIKAYVLSCLWDDAYKKTLAAVDFHFRYLSSPLPYVRRHITVNKMC